MRRCLLVLAVTSCVAAGCGSNDEDDVRATVDDLYAGFAERDSAKVCGTLTSEQREKVRGGAAAGGKKPQSCEQVMGFALAFAGDALKDVKKAEITKVEVKGDKARATVTYRGKATPLGLAKQGDAWKISDFDLSKL